MATATNCYYCKYPLPSGAAVCPECGSGINISGPVRSMHRSITTAWGMLGLVLVLFTFPWPIAVLSEYLRGLSLSAALPPGGLPGIVLDVLGVLVGAGIAVWSLVARRRKDAIPKLPIFLVLSLGFYLVGLVLTFLVRLFELFT